MPETKEPAVIALIIPTPMVAPFGIPVDKAELVHDVWSAFIEPGQKPDARPQSVEERALMAILRAVHEGLNRVTPCTRCADKKPGPPRDDAGIKGS